MSRFLRAYEDYVGHCTATPIEFRHAGGLACLSTIAVGRKWIEQGGQIRPNLFQMLVADSSQDYKTTAVKLARGIIELVQKDRIGPTDFTPEGLLFYMRKRKEGAKTKNKLTLFIDEFGTILATTATYNQGLPSVLCELYDGERVVRTRSGKAPSIIDKPRVSILGAVAYGMFERYAQPNDWITGFYARFLYVTPTNRPTPYPMPPKTPTEERNTVAAMLGGLKQQLEGRHGPMEITSSSEKLFQEYAKVFRPGNDDPVIGAQRERMMTIILKLAMLYQIDENPEMPIGDLAMERAVSFARKSWDSFLKVYNTTAGSESARYHRRVWDAISAAGPQGISRRDILRRFHMNVERLTPILDALVKNEAVKIEARGNQAVFVAKVAPPQPFGQADIGEPPEE